MSLQSATEQGRSLGGKLIGHNFSLQERREKLYKHMHLLLDVEVQAPR